MEIRLLGPLDVRDGDGPVSLPRRQQRALLAALALRAGEVVSTDRLIADLWGASAPASATGSLQNTVSALRKRIGRDVLVTQPPGYRLAIGPEDVDVNRFERLVKEAREAESTAAARLLGEALDLWRGPALADLDDEHFARLEAARLDELRVTAIEELLDAELELGRHAARVGELEQLVATYPLRERLRGQLMLALYRCGRQAEALEVYRAARLALADELGLDPSPELQELERKILRQDPELAAPAAVRNDTRRPSAELRLVTVLAATPPADDDPERHRVLVDETLGRLREALGRHGGVLERFGPEGLVAVFGAEAPQDDDAERAVLVARELGLPTGIATGEAVEGVGAVFTRAAELARGGGIRLDERTAALVRASRRLDAPLAGREAELERLLAAFAMVRENGRCRAVTVLGEPGIGKTRLARELALREGAAATVLVARCIAQGPGATFLPLLGALRRAEPERVLATEPGGDLILTRLSALAEGEAPLGESYWAVRRLLEALARTQPVLLVLDDVHWAEPALVDLVDYLADRAEGPILVLSLSRPELERPLGQPIALGPLRVEDVRTIAAEFAELDEATRERIVDLAEGNPLYVEQLATFAAEGGEGLPPTIEAVLAARLGRLEQEQRAVLQRAAVVGREFSLGAVAALVGGEVARELLALSRSGFVHPAPTTEPGDDGYTFHHVLLRDAAYASLTKADRAQLHERAAAWVDRDGPGDDALAGYHLEQAFLCRRELGDEADDVAAAAGERLGDAGMRVWRTNDPRAAAGLLGRACALLPEGRRRAELLYEWSLTLRSQDQTPEADSALDRAEQDATVTRSDAIAARVAAERAFLTFFTGALSLRDATKTLHNATNTLRAAADVRGVGRAELYSATIHAFACNFADWGAAAARAEQEYAAAGFSTATAVGIQAEALYLGDPPVAEALSQCEVLQRRSSDKLAEATVSAVAAALNALRGSHDEAARLIAHSRRLYDDLGTTRGTEMNWAPLAFEVLRLAGDLDAAEELARSNVEAMTDIGYPAYESARAAVLADFLVSRGDLEAADHFAELAERVGFDTDVYVQFGWRAARARLLARAGELDRAEAMAADAVKISSLTDAVCDRARTHAAMAEVLVLAGKSAAAKQQQAQARTLLRRKGATALLDALEPQMRGALSSSSHRAHD